MASPNLIKETQISSIIPHTGHKMIWVKSTDNLAHTLKTLTDHKIHSVPVFDTESKKFVAFVDLIDFAVHLGRTYIENEIIEGSVSRMLEEEQRFTTLQIADESSKNPWYTVNLHAPLKEVMEMIIHHGIHRVAVVDSEDDLKYVLTQTDLISFIHQHLDKISQLKSKTVEELNLGFKEVISVTVKEQVWKALIMMNSKGVSGIGIVEEDGSIIGHISSADLKGVDFDTHIMTKLKQTVAEFKKEMKVVSVLPTATFSEVVETLKGNKVHRVYVVPPGSQIPVGVISQIDVISAVYNIFK